MQVAQVLDRRIERRVPAAYLTQEAWLGEFRFYVDERVIIPRSYIAELLPDGLAPYVGARSSSRALSTSAPGPGCLAILLAHTYPAVDVDAVDVSNDALTVAQRNVADYGLADRINLIRSDLFANLSERATTSSSATRRT
jgi:ribosomal protein L3 glutamine methyltransferase